MLQKVINFIFVSALCHFVISQFILPTAAYAFPSPPTSVSATDGTQNQITVTWNLPTTGDAPSTFFIYRTSLNQPCSGTPIAALSPSDTSFVDTSFPNTNVFYYSLRSVSASGESSLCSDSDSGFANGFPPPGAPDPVVASDDLFDRITVSWTLPSNSQPFDSLTLYRTDREGLRFCNDAPIAENLPANLTSYEDFTAEVGVPYFYALKSSGDTGISNCSAFPDAGRRLLPPPPNPPVNVNATDGDFEDRVVVSWNPPVGGGVFDSFKIYRSENISAGCSELHIDSIPVSARSVNDVINVIPGQQYYYWMRAQGPEGPSECSALDPGHAQINAPRTVQASDGTFPDKVVVKWTPPAQVENLTGYNLYRDTVPNSCGRLIASNLPVSPLEFDDTDVIPGVIYYYSFVSRSALGDSACSNIDPGHALTECSDGIDNDGDGGIDAATDPGCTDVFDNDEHDANFVCDDGLDNDGDGLIDFQIDGSGDLGCESPVDPEEENDAALLSPAFAKFNTFLGQSNFAELINQGDEDKQVDLVVYNLRGEVMIERSVVVPAESEIDVDVNGLVQFACDVLETGCEGFQDLSATRGDSNGLGRPDGIVDTYGLVSFVFDDSDPEQQLLGRISNYRPNGDGTFSFALAREFRNPIKGAASYALANTHDPRGLGNLVPNWAEVIALGTRNEDGSIERTDLGFTLNFYSQSGELLDTTKFTLPGLGEYDYAAGHEFLNPSGDVIESVYLVEVIPDSPDAEYFLSIARYSSNAPAGFDPGTYNYGVVLDGKAGTSETLYAPIGNTINGIDGLDKSVTLTNWVETACVSDVACRVRVNYRNAAGNVISSQIEDYFPKGQEHFHAGVILPQEQTGSVEITTLRGKVFAQSMSYVHGDLNELQSGFVSAARARGRAEQIGSVNTFLNMQNSLEVTATTASSFLAELNINTFSLGSFGASISINSGGSSALGISSGGSLNIPSNTFGAMMLNTPNDGEALAEVRRVRLDSKGGVDFVIPTLVK